MSAANRFGLPDLGIGVGLRAVHVDHVLRERPAVDFFELLSENYLYTEGRPLRVADEVAARWPVVLHGVSLSIGSTDPLDLDHLQRLKRFADRVRAAWVGDHVCWTGVAGRNTHDLLPLPCTETCLAHVVERVKRVQDLLGRPLVLENASTYATFCGATMTEEEFLARLLDDADCALLLDVNNVYVSCRNHDRDPEAWIDAVPAERVVQIHVAGHADKGTHCIDTHGAAVIDPVWRLYERFTRRAGPRATVLERDQDIPPFDELLAEARIAGRFRGAAVSDA